MNWDLLYIIPEEKHDKKELLEILQSQQQIKFISLVGIDFLGNDTDEKIPVQNFIENIDTFLPGIASLNNAKVDMKADLNCKWYIDYNYENIDTLTGKPVGTLRIPCFLYHDNVAVDSRNILKSSISYFNTSILKLLKDNPAYLTKLGISFEDIKEVAITAATELEFWVNTPNDFAEIEELSTSEVLK